MAREHEDGHTPHEESIGAATRALADATAALTRLIGKQVSNAVPEVSETIAVSLREASRGLAEASEKVERSAGGRRGQDRRQEKVDRTRSELLAAAARVFAAHGYEGASVGDIAAEAGFTKGALYAHFGSKSEVFLALARESLLVRHEATCDEPELPGVTAEGIDEAAIAAWLRDAQQNPSLLLMLEFVSYGIRHPEARAELGAVQEQGLEHFAEQVAALRAARRGAATEEPTTEDRDIALAIVSVANMAAMLSLLTDSPHTSPEAGARVIARLLEG
ncbi:TetR/AcrR family transcriptional regulator [Cellulomonas sp. APG4]|uniref:TetR/AcrR family transcriptional regulator n=1 Tax=Cellulomonas sp. APG4 TaxID=1538656 RepID=UPI00137A20D6|nr:TetR/AcrR family transcriptional regulator [Cellulomonas sp. APG4]NCT91589.1 TetR/AcrR family transcriptional regulator [Cellulomonas sp. APG4]